VSLEELGSDGEVGAVQDVIIELFQKFLWNAGSIGGAG
jgi:hypothetical protein